MQEGESRLAKYWTQTVAPTSRAFLKPAAALAEETGIHASKFQLALWAYSQALHTCALEKHERLIRSTAAYCDNADTADGKFDLWLYVRGRKFDETTSVMGCEWDHGPELLSAAEHLVERRGTWLGARGDPRAVP